MREPVPGCFRLAHRPDPVTLIGLPRQADPPNTVRARCSLRALRALRSFGLL
jgi:hypothetical protein